VAGGAASTRRFVQRDNCVVAEQLRRPDSRGADLTNPVALLDHARDLEPLGLYAERKATLDQVQELLDAGRFPPAPVGRDWRLELIAERAIDSTREKNPNGRALVDQVVRDADPSQKLALGRALLAGGQQLAWEGTDTATAMARREFGQAAAIFASIGRRDWQGSALLRCGYSAHYQYGDLVGAEQLMNQALDAYGPGQRRDAALTSYADVLIDLGEFDRADRALTEAAEAAVRREDRKITSEIIWGQARIAAGRGDAQVTERLLHEAEQAAVDAQWFETHMGGFFLLEAAELLDRVGLTKQAHQFFEKATDPSRTHTKDWDESILQTRAILLARSGDPVLALEALQEIVRGDWLEKRSVWRHTMMQAWASFRGGRNGAGVLAARALDQAASAGGGGSRVAVAGERDVTSALAPLAEHAGSTIARELLVGDRQLLVRLFGIPSVTRRNGELITLPPGKPGELVRMLALNPGGLPVETVLGWFFPDIAPTTARNRLRQILARLRAAAGEIVVRDADNLLLAPAWIDVDEFLATANRVDRARGARAVQVAYACLALHTGPLLPEDVYAEWSLDARDRIEARHTELLDLIAADAIARDSHQEALMALEAALANDPDDVDHQQALLQQLRALGHHQAAARRERRFSERR
jgi:DNA-binding SARP family transcriptional activator